MKKIGFLMIAALLPLMSCQKQLDNVKDTNDEQTVGNAPIVFGVDELTKAVTESTVDALKGSTTGFKVAGVMSDNTVLFNENAKWVAASSYFKTANSYYYPSTGAMSFYAAYPSRDITVSSSGAASLSYTNDLNTDLIVASATGVIGSEVSGSLALAFGHILSEVFVQAKGSDSTVDYKVTSVKVNATKSGTYAYSTGTWSPSTTKQDNTYLSTAKAVTTSYTDLGSVQTYITDKVTVKIEWDCYIKGTSTLIAHYTAEVPDHTLVKGQKTNFKLTLNNNKANPITFTVTVSAWTSANEDVTLNGN